MSRLSRVPSLLYLAGPIDHVSKDDSQSWRSDFSETFHAVHMDPCVIFSPAHAYLFASPHSGKILSTLNRHVISQSSVMIVWLVDGFGFETVREIEYATRAGKPVVAMMPSGYEHHLGMWDLHLVQGMDVAVDKTCDLLSERRG